MNARHTKKLPGTPERRAGEPRAQEAANLGVVAKFLAAGNRHTARPTGGRATPPGMPKTLTEMNIPLVNVLSEIRGVRGEAIVLVGEGDPDKRGGIFEGGRAR